MSAPMRGARRRSPEKKVEKAGDELMDAFGFTAIRFSQARATMQTRGIPDRRYYRPAKSFGCSRVVWWEAKAATKQSVYQKAFQALCESCCEKYVCGGVEALEAYLIECGLARRVAGGLVGIRQTKVLAVMAGN